MIPLAISVMAAFGKSCRSEIVCEHSFILQLVSLTQLGHKTQTLDVI